MESVQYDPRNGKKKITLKTKESGKKMFIPSRGDFTKNEWFEIRNEEKNELIKMVKTEIKEWKNNFKEEIQITKIRIKARFK